MEKKIELIITNPEIMGEPFEESFINLLNNRGLKVKEGSFYESSILKKRVYWLVAKDSNIPVDIGWKHSPENLINTFLERTPRLSDSEADNIIRNYSLEDKIKYVSDSFGYVIKESDQKL